MQGVQLLVICWVWMVTNILTQYIQRSKHKNTIKQYIYVPQVLSQLAHELDGAPGGLAALQRDLAHLAHLDQRLAAARGRVRVEARGAGGLAHGYLVLVHDAVACLDDREGVGDLCYYMCMCVCV